MKEIEIRFTEFLFNNGIAFLSLVVSLVVAWINNKNKKEIEKYKGENAHNIQVEQYFKQIGTEKQSNILNDWTNFVTDIEKFQLIFSNEKKLIQMKHDVVMYGSNRTISILAEFFQYTYKSNVQMDTYKGIVYAAFIVSSLKYDFSGYKSNPEDFLKLQMRDYTEYKDKLFPYFEEIRKETKCNL